MSRIWAFGIFIVFTTFFWVNYNIRLEKTIVLQEAQANMTSLISFVEMDLKRALTGLDQLFIGLDNYLSAYPSLDKVDQPKTRRIFDNLILKNDYLTALMVIDTNGQVRYWNNNLQKPNIRQRSYVNVHISGQQEGLYIDLPQASLLNKGQWIFGISKAVRKTDGSLDKILAAIIDLKYFYRQYRSLIEESGTTLTIASPDGHIYTRIPDHEQYAGQQLTDASAAQLLPGGTTKKLFHIEIDGQPQLIAAQKLNSYPLIITLAKKETAILTPWERSAWSFLSLAIGISVAVLFLTYRTVLSRKKQMEVLAELQKQSLTDPLTKLSNRRYVLEQSQREIKKAIRNKSPLSLILLDLDRFKEFNDIYGHQAGDNALEEIARRLTETCRESDIISRFDGEQFLLLLPSTDMDGAMHSAKKIWKTIGEEAFNTPQGEIQLTVSCGVTQWGNDETDLNGPLRRAELAMQQVKKQGRNNIKGIPSNLRDEKSSIIWLDQRLK